MANEKEQETKAIDVRKLHEELEAAGLPVMGVDNLGRVHYARLLDPSETAAAAAVVAGHDAEPSKKEKLKQRVMKSKLGSDMLLALWSSVVDGDNTLLDELRSTWEKVKTS